MLARALPSGLAYLASRQRWKPAPHLNYLTQRLVDLEQRRITRLLVELPPRHGKSNLCSQYFPAWYLGRHPDHNVIMASYEAGFAQFWGERARDALAEYGPSVFGVAVSSRNKASDWRIDGHIGRMRCTGVAAGMTGRGADLLIIDDPIKDAIEANSEIIRQRIWDWYSSVARTRLEPGGVVVVIQTRWHQEDLIGRLRRQQSLGGEAWDAVTLPAVCETLGDPMGRQIGDALWPERYNVADLAAIRSTIPAHWWEALFQQRPTPPGGGLAQTLWFPVVYALPAGEMRFCRYWDCAGGEGKRQGSDPDWTVGAKLGRSRDGRFFICDIMRVRKTFGEVDKLIKQMAMLDGPECLIREEQEGGSSGLAVVSQRARGLAGFNYRGVPKRQTKVVAWQPMLIQAEVGNVFMMAAPWNQGFLQEVSDAPHGSHDDQLDAVSGAFAELAKGSSVPASELLGIGGGADELRSAVERKIF